MNILYRLLKNLKPNGDCLEYQGSIDNKGYGTISYKGNKKAVHRLLYELVVREIPEGAYILHSCDNRKCCNINHLREGSHKDNMRDMVERNRQARGSRNAGAKLKEEQVLEIRRLHAEGSSQKALAAKFKISPIQISRIVRFEKWKHLS